MQDWNQIDARVKAMLQEELMYALRYWVSLDPATRSQYVHPVISLNPHDMDIDVEAVPGFMAWLKMNGMTKVSRLSGWAQATRERDGEL
jgi:hypothetical protein